MKAAGANVRLLFPQMEQEDPEQFLHRAGTAVNAVSRADDQFARRPVEMAAGVRHHPVAAAGTVGPFPVATICSSARLRPRSPRCFEIEARFNLAA